jgi:hypothetical protein
VRVARNCRGLRRGSIGRSGCEACATKKMSEWIAHFDLQHVPTAMNRDSQHTPEVRV